jgi:O-antigen/teichoic acid export membrane protein
LLKKNKIFVAGTWVIFAFGLSQLIRLGSNLIVTRLLEPQMFGVMAVVHVVIFGITMFTDIGLWAFVVRHKNPENPHMLNAVWTLQVGRGWLMFMLILIGAIYLIVGNQFWPSLFDGIYTNSQLPYLIIVAGFASVISSYKSMASPVLHRKLEVGKLEAIEIISQIAGLIVMLSWVWLYPSIWALVSAGVISTLVSTILSFTLFPFRHKLVWDKAINKEVFDFSKWIVFASALTFLFSQADKLYFAAKIDAAALGVYSIAFMLVAMINTVAQTLAEKVVFPVFSSQVHGDRLLLKEKYYRIRLYLDLPMFFIAGLIVALGPFIIGTLYDDRYANAGWILQILVVSVVGNTLSLVSMECLSALSVTKVRMWVMLIRTISLFVGLPLFYHYYGFYGAIWVVAINVWVSLPLTYYTLAKNSVFDFIKEIRMLPFVGIGYIVGYLFNNIFS